MSYYTATSLVGAHRFRVPFPKLQTFSEIFWAPHFDYSQYEKTMLGIFVYLFIYEVTMIKILVFRNSAVKPQHVFFESELFLRKLLISFFSSNIPLYTGKSPEEKLCKVLEMELKTHSPVGLKFISEKIKFKVFIIFNMVSFDNTQGSVKIRLPCSKAFLLTISSSNTVSHSDGCIKSDKYLFFCRSRCGKCSPETKPLTK